jgi:hypothetical protein
MEETCTNSQRLRSIIALTSGGLSTRIHEFWMHTSLGDLYPEFLFGLYGIVVASTPLIRHAAMEAEKLASADPLARLLAPYLHEHAEEETGHERWLLEDLECLGFGREQVLHRLPYTSVAKLVGAQYYLAAHVHPVAMLGYLSVLENPASPEFLEGVAQRNHLPIESFSTLLKHARLDVGHVAEFDHMLDSLSLTQRQRDIMTMSAISSVSYLEAFFEEVLEHFNRADDDHGVDGIFHYGLQHSPTQASSAEEVRASEAEGHLALK